jgi:hypothetical protein
LPGGRPRVDRGHAWASMSLPRPSSNLVARSGDSFARAMGTVVRRRNWHFEVLSTHPGRRRARSGERGAASPSHRQRRHSTAAGATHPQRPRSPATAPLSGGRGNSPEPGFAPDA